MERKGKSVATAKGEVEVASKKRGTSRATRHESCTDTSSSSGQKGKEELRNSDGFKFNMFNTRTPPKYDRERLHMEMTTEMGDILQQIRIEKTKFEELTAGLYLLDGQLGENKHTFFAENREEEKAILSKLLESSSALAINVPDPIREKMAEIESSKERVKELESQYWDLDLQKELQKPGKKPRRLRPEELVTATKRPVYKWF